jgi:2EXR family
MASIAVPQDSLSLDPSSGTPLEPLTEFTLFHRLPPEVRALIWKAAVGIDFSNKPTNIKTYAEAFGNIRAPPKTARINQESRRETLRSLRRMIVHKEEAVHVERFWDERWKRWISRRRHNPTRYVLWDRSTDILTLDVSVTDYFLFRKPSLFACLLTHPNKTCPNYFASISLRHFKVEGC